MTDLVGAALEHEHSRLEADGSAREDELPGIQARIRADWNDSGALPALLNFRDLFAYALARSRGAPLLFKGADFAATDVEPAWRG